MLIYNDNMKFAPERAGMYPILLPVDGTGMNGFEFQDSISSLKTKFKRVYKSGMYWYADTSKSYNVNLSWDNTCKKRREQVDVTFRISPRVPARWYNYKPLVCADIIKYGPDTATIRIRLNDGSTVDFTSKKSYFAGKARECIQQSMPYCASTTNGLGIYGPNMPLEKREELRRLLPYASKIQNLDWVPDWNDVRYEIAPYYVRGEIDYLALLEGGFIPSLPRCNSSKPFAKGSSFMLKISPSMFCLLKDVNQNNAQLVKCLEDAGSTDIARDMEIIHAMICQAGQRSTPDFGTNYIDDYGSRICCIGVCYIKAVTAEKVIERYTKQDEHL